MERLPVENGQANELQRQDETQRRTRRTDRRRAELASYDLAMLGNVPPRHARRSVGRSARVLWMLQIHTRASSRSAAAAATTAPAQSFADVSRIVTANVLTARTRVWFQSGAGSVARVRLGATAPRPPAGPAAPLRPTSSTPAVRRSFPAGKHLSELRARCGTSVHSEHAAAEVKQPPSARPPPRLVLSCTKILPRYYRGTISDDTSTTVHCVVHGTFSYRDTTSTRFYLQVPAHNN